MSILIGYDINGKTLQLDFWSKELANRHFLITGMSGQGKTYATQHLLNEITMSGFTALVFDCDKAFSDSQLNPVFCKTVEERIECIDLRKSKAPINPFRLYNRDRDDEMESEVEAADRIASLLAQVMKLGEQQRQILYEIFRLFFIAQSNIREHMSGKDSIRLTENERITIGMLTKQIKSHENPLSILRNQLSVVEKGTRGNIKSSVLSKLVTFIDMMPFSENTFDWGDYIYNHGKITIMQFGGYSKDMSRLMLEFILWDLWDYTTRKGSAHKPFVTVFDECQYLNYSSSSPASRILRQGRKFGYSSWFITQFIHGAFEADVVGLLEQAATKLFFRPHDKDIENVAKSIDPSNPKQWIPYVESLRKGQCIAKGCFVKQSNPSRSADYPPIILDIPQL